MPDSTATPAVRVDEATPCSACGRFGAYLFDGKALCSDCYQSRGSCCAECEMETDDSAEGTHPARQRGDRT